MPDDETPVNKTGEEESETPAEEPNKTPVIDTTAYEAKIQNLTTDIAAKDAAIAQLNAQIIAQKAANYDLLTQIGTEPPLEQETELDIPDEEGVGIEDLFKYSR